jgi:hypothetical protein
MGLWWKDVNVKPPEDKGYFVTFNGDSAAISKRWPILWRFGQNWHILQIAHGDSPCQLYFRSEDGRIMRYRRRIYTEYAAVRVGPESVMFWATGFSPLRHHKIFDTLNVIPNLLRPDKRTDFHRSVVDRLLDKNKIQFV